jgi:hypothetical protein
MTTPSITSTNPSDMQVDVSVNQLISISFNTAIEPTSVGVGTVILYVSDTVDIVPVDFSVSNNVISVLPRNELLEETSYTLIVVGDNNAPTVEGIKSLDTLTQMVGTTQVIFRTGFEKYAKLEEVTSRTDYERIGPVRLEDLTVTKDLYLVSSNPKNYSGGIDLDKQIDIVFSSGIIDASSIAQYIQIDQAPVLGIDDYYGLPNIDASGCEYKLKAEVAGDTSYDFTPPSYTLSVSGSTLSINFDKDLLLNEELIITISDQLKAIDNTTVLGKEETLMFTSKYYPLFSSAQMMRFELGSAINTFNTDTINRIILKNSIEYWETGGRSFKLCEPDGFARKFVKCRTVIDLIDLLTMSNQLNEGTTKTLGDFTVSQNNLSSNGGPKRASAEKCVEEEMRRLSISKCGPQVGILGSRASVRTEMSLRLWSVSMFKKPLSNDRAERDRKEYAIDGSSNAPGAWTWTIS